MMEVGMSNLIDFDSMLEAKVGVLDGLGMGLGRSWEVTRPHNLPYLGYLGGLILSYLPLSCLILPYLTLSYLTLVTLLILATTDRPTGKGWGQHVSLGNTLQDRSWSHFGPL